MRALIIARLTFQEAFQRKMVWGVVALSGVFILLYLYGFHLFVEDFAQIQARRDEQGLGPIPTYEIMVSSMVLLGMYTVNFLTGIMTIFAAVGSISSEIEAGTLHAVIPKPLSRWEIVAGKFVGYATMLVVYIALMVSAVLLIAYFVGDYTPPNIMQGTLLIILVSIILLSLTMLGSTLFSTIANGVIVFMLYGMAVTGGLVEQIGALLSNDVMIRIGVFTSLILPSDSMWRLASYVMQPGLAINFAGPNPLGTTTPPSAFAVQYAIIYCIVLFTCALFVFQRRDI